MDTSKAQSTLTPQTTAKQQLTFLAWLIWGLAAGYFFCDYFARVSTGVMASDLIRSFNITAVGLGSLSAFFYYPYLAMQLPVGLIVDRFSIRYLLTTMTLITAIGCIIFGMARGIHIAQLGRFLIGFSAAFAFVSALKLATDWFPPHKLGLLAGLTQAAGMLGAAVGDAPVAYSVTQIGWRHTMLIMAIIFILLGLFIYLIVRDHPEAAKNKIDKENRGLSIGASLKCILANPQTWLNALYAGMVYAPTAAFAELWGVTYLEHARHLTIHQAAMANGLIFIGWAAGGPVFGWISDKLKKRKPLMYFSPTAGLIILAILFFTPNLSVATIYFLLFSYGITNTGVAIAYAVATEINPHPVIGASIAFTNMFSVIPGATLQIVIGKLIDIFATGTLVKGIPIYTTKQLLLPMLTLPICSILGIVLAYFIRETHCKPLTRPTS